MESEIGKGKKRETKEEEESKKIGRQRLLKEQQVFVLAFIAK